MAALGLPGAKADLRRQQAPGMTPPNEIMERVLVSRGITQPARVAVADEPRRKKGKRPKRCGEVKRYVNLTSYPRGTSIMNCVANRAVK